jgi:hypothetical protein
MKKRVIKVLGFDSWTMGSAHYIRLIEAFNANNIELLLIHLGSWGNDVKREKEENIRGLKVRDISFYNTTSFKKILEIEKPDLVLFLSTGSFAHRAMLRYCKMFSIPTINLSHGIMSVGHYKGENAPVKISLFAHLKWVMSRSKMSLYYVFPIYLKSLLDTNASLPDWLRFFSDITDRIFYKEQYKYASDAKPTAACVFVNEEIEDAMIRYSLKKEQVEVVGNPDLMKFDINNDIIEEQLSIDRRLYTDIVYIECGMTFFGVYFNSTEEYCEYILKIANTLKYKGYRLLFKIKPQTSEYLDKLSKGLSDRGIEIIYNESFQQSLFNSRACITEPSTLGIIPQLLGLPVFLNKISALETLMYGDIFTLYPGSIQLTSIENFDSQLMKSENDSNKDLLKNWIETNAGPLPASDMPYRVAKVVKKIVR